MSYELLILLLLVWSLTVVAAFIGWRWGALPARTAGIAAVALGAFLAAGAWLERHLGWLPEELISPYAVYLQSGWFAPPAVALFLLGMRQVRERERAGAVTRGSVLRQSCALALMIAVTMLAASLPFLGPPDTPPRLAYVNNGLSDHNGVVRQSTGYTCGPASCATLVRRLGIDPQATEEQMVPLCMTRRWSGVTTLGMAVGLKSLAEPLGWHVRLMEPDWPTFLRLRKPLVCAVQWSPLVDHSVVVCAVHPKWGVQVADPMLGLAWVPAAKFQQVFQNEAVAVFRDNPFERQR